MLCRNPFIQAGRAYGCGQCMPCRYNRRRIWTHRLMLERHLHGDAAFVTLTYSDEFLPTDGSLVPRHLQLWLKRLRKEFGPVRFYAVGEYGDESWRPHYHVALFGFPHCRAGCSLRRDKLGEFKRPCVSCACISRTWAMGRVDVKELAVETAQYCCGYIVKKLVKGDERLKGRYPEFARMSNRPGIGRDAMWDVADVVMKYDLEKKLVDVPLSLRHGPKELPLGRYLQGKLREYVGREKATPQAVLDAISEELHPVRQAAFDGSSSFKKAVINAGNAKFANMQARQRIWKGRRSL